MHLHTYFTAEMAALNEKINEKTAILVSGGVDSMVLLDLLNKDKRIDNSNIHLIYIDHNTRIDDIKREIELISYICNDNKNNFVVIPWHYKEKNFQQEARKARYSLAAAYCKQNNISKCLTAHHADDQIENFFIGIDRKSGINGISGISKSFIYQNVTIMRPMLTVYKETIIEYAKANKLKWIEDSSNVNLQYQRNYFRDVIKKLNLLDQKQNILTIIGRMKEVKIILNFYKEQEKKKCVAIKSNSIEIDRKYLLSLPEEMMRLVIIDTIQLYNYQDTKPRMKGVKRLISLLKEKIYFNFNIKNCHIKANRNLIMMYKMHDK